MLGKCFHFKKFQGLNWTCATCPQSKTNTILAFFENSAFCFICSKRSNDNSLMMSAKTARLGVSAALPPIRPIGSLSPISSNFRVSSWINQQPTYKFPALKTKQKSKTQDKPLVRALREMGTANAVRRMVGMRGAKRATNFLAPNIPEDGPLPKILGRVETWRPTQKVRGDLGILHSRSALWSGAAPQGSGKYETNRVAKNFSFVVPYFLRDSCLLARATYLCRVENQNSKFF